MHNDSSCGIIFNTVPQSADIHSWSSALQHYVAVPSFSLPPCALQPQRTQVLWVICGKDCKNKFLKNRKSSTQEQNLLEYAIYLMKKIEVHTLYQIGSSSITQIWMKVDIIKKTMTWYQYLAKKNNMMYLPSHSTLAPFTSDCNEHTISLRSSICLFWLLFWNSSSPICIFNTFIYFKNYSREYLLITKQTQIKGRLRYWVYEKKKSLKSIHTYIFLSTMLIKLSYILHQWPRDGKRWISCKFIFLSTYKYNNTVHTIIYVHTDS